MLALACNEFTFINNSVDRASVYLHILTAHQLGLPQLPGFMHHLLTFNASVLVLLVVAVVSARVYNAGCWHVNAVHVSVKMCSFMLTRQIRHQRHKRLKWFVRPTLSNHIVINEYTMYLVRDYQWSWQIVWCKKHNTVHIGYNSTNVNKYIHA